METYNFTEEDRVYCRNTNCAHYDCSGVIKAVLCSDSEYGIYEVEWDDGKKTVALGKNLEPGTGGWNGYVFTSFSADEYTFPDHCAFEVVDGYIYGKKGKGNKRFRNVTDLRNYYYKQKVFFDEIEGFFTKDNKGC